MGTKKGTKKVGNTGPGLEDFAGKAVFIRTVTNFYTGRVVAVTPLDVVIEDAAWIAETQRWADTLLKGAAAEIEPYPDGPVVVSRGAIVDVCLWAHPLPRTQL